MSRWFGADRAGWVATREGNGASKSLADVLQLAEERIEAIVVASRIAADQIRSEVETHLGSPPDPNVISRERLVAELTKTLIERAERLSGEAEELSRILGRAAKAVVRQDTAPSPSPPPPALAPPSESDPQPPAAAKPATSGGFVGRSGRSDGAASGKPDERRVSEGMRLLATQMAVAGSSRGEIELRLRRGFDVTDASSILTEVLGPGSR